MRCWTAKRSISWTLAAGASAFIVLALGSQLNTAAEASPTGGLRCAIAEGPSRFLGSSRALDCLYTSDDGGREHYRGTISKIGPDIGYQRRGMIYWAVLSPNLRGQRGENLLATTWERRRAFRLVQACMLTRSSGATRSC